MPTYYSTNTSFTILEKSLAIDLGFITYIHVVHNILNRNSLKIKAFFIRFSGFQTHRSSLNSLRVSVVQLQPYANSYTFAGWCTVAEIEKMGKSSTIDAFYKRESAEISTMGKSSTIDAFYKRESAEISTVIGQSGPSNPHERLKKNLRVELIESFDVSSMERDPGLRPQIWQYTPNKHDEIRRAYIKAGAYQCKLSQYPKSGEKRGRSFQQSWFHLFPSWFEYSPNKDAIFCLPCYLFHKKDGPSGSDAFTVNVFISWKKVEDGKNCALLAHVGKDITSPYRNAEKACANLMNQALHITHSFQKFSSQEIIENRLRLKASIEATLWLAFQGCPFRGHDESKTSINRGNFLELLNLMCSYNDRVAEVVNKAPRNASYTSPTIQKEILQVLAAKLKDAIREEIGDAKFCIIVDEDGYVRERFFGLVHVKDTAASTLKEGIFSVLCHHNLDIQSIRGQGYDSASNMRGEWKELQALVSNECHYAYYVHCLAHRLQLALVAASKEVIPIHQFFTQLNFIINIVGASCKRNDQLKAAHAANIAHLLEIEELESGKGLNQIGALQRAGDTRWSSHLKSISSLIKMFSATCEVLLNIIDDGTTSARRGDADAAYEVLTSFEFVFILHLMRNFLEISNLLCQALQLQSQDILNALHLVSSTKLLIQKLREDGWEELVLTTKSFCEAVNILVPDFSVIYVARRGRARHQQDKFTVEHHYKVDIFNAVIDSQLQELNNKFNDHTVELLTLCSALDPREKRTKFRVDDICKLVQKFYPRDFEEYEMMQLRVQFEHFSHLLLLPDFESLSTISDLCQWMVKTRKYEMYPLVYKIVTLILTLSVSTATTERSFSAMNIFKTMLRNKMEDEYLSDCLLVYIEKEIAKQFELDSLIDDFRDLKERHSFPSYNGKEDSIGWLYSSEQFFFKIKTDERQGEREREFDSLPHGRFDRSIMSRRGNAKSFKLGDNNELCTGF
ncbi:uncharacterized protein LOC126687539 [Mercurialis annua]|uniref:uncharacterized protein LOC126687539 n=1 Tax=Mercurialis annua TaxID=3986 RepID=UPI002160173E|nr:uncharacterized protein LOC126687539 [Mercurialis annua]